MTGRVILAARLPRHRNGGIDWHHPDTAGRIKNFLRRGRSVRYISERLGLHVAAAHYGIRELGLNAAPRGEVFLPEVAQTLGVDITAVHALAHRRGLTLRRWGGRRTLPTAEVMALTEEYVRQRVTARPEAGLLSTADLSARWHMNQSSVRKRLREAGVRPALILNSRYGRCPMYAPRDVAQAAPPVRAPKRPVGHLSTKEVSDLVGRSLSGVTLWARRGAPHTRGLHGWLWFPAERLAEWLERQGGRLAPRAAALREHLAQQQQRRAA